MADKDIIKTNEAEDKSSPDNVEDMEVLYVEPEDYFPKEIREKYFSETDEEDDE